MTRDSSRTRRTVLKAAAVVPGAAILAGCGGPGGEDDPDVEFEEGTGNGQDRNDTDDNGSDGDGAEPEGA